MADDTLADSVTQLNTLAGKLAARTTPSEQAAATVLRAIAAKLPDNGGQLSVKDIAAIAATATGFGPEGAMGGWRE